MHQDMAENNDDVKMFDDSIATKTDYIEREAKGNALDSLRKNIFWKKKIHGPKVNPTKLRHRKFKRTW